MLGQTIPLEYMVIKAMLGKTTPIEYKIAVIIAQAKEEASISLKTSLYYVKRELNLEAYIRAKKAIELSLGEIEKNEN
jgi:hypothetical protein